MAKDVGMMDGAEQARVRMQPVTIRFAPEAWHALKGAARQTGVSVAEMARGLIIGSLNRYTDSVKFLDEDDAKAVRSKMAEIGNGVSRVALELNRIGVNYNQEVRALNALTKGGCQTGTGRPAASALRRDELEKLLSEYRQIGKKVGELQCLIRG